MAERFSKNLNVPVFIRETENTVTEEQAEKFSQINQASASVPTSVMVQAAKNNLDTGMVDEINNYFSRANEKSPNTLKSSIFTSLGINPETGGFGELAIKGLFLGVRQLWEQFLPRAGRAISLAQQGEKNPWKKANVSPFKIWNEKRKSGELIDLGTALFGDTNPEDTEEYKQLIDNGATPTLARELVQARLGTNIWTDIETDSRKVKMTDETALALQARGRGDQATFGRVMWQPLHFIAGPEDRAYDFFTGTIDLIANLFDPTFLLGKGVKTVKAGKSMLALRTTPKAGVGLLNGWVRKSFSKTTAREVIEGKEGLKLSKFLFENRKNPAEILEQSNFRFVNKYIMRNQELSDDVTKFMLELENLDANSVEEGAKLVQNLLTDKILVSATGGVVPAYGPKMKRFGRTRTMLDTYFGARYTKRLSATNPDNLLVNYTKFLKQLDPTGKNIDRNARVGSLIKQLDALQTKDPLLRGKILISEITEDIGSVRGIIEDSLDEKQLAKSKDLIGRVFKNLKQFTESVNGEVSQLARKYTSLNNMPEDAQKVFKQHFIGQGYTDEAIEEMFNTFANRPIIETVLTQDFYLPDPSDVIKLVNRLDRSMKGQYLNALGIVGDSAFGKYLDIYVGTIFKPLVLLRPAWTVRVIAEEQIRAVADGVLGIADHPIALMARMGLMENRPSYAKSGWLNSGRFEVGIAESESRAFNTLTGKTARQGVEWKTVYRYNNSGKVAKEWKEGQFRVITNYMDSYLARGVAAVNRAAPKDKAIQVEKLVNKMVTNGTVEREAMLSLAADMGKGKNAWKALKTSKDKNLVREFLNTLEDDMTKALTGRTISEGGVIGDDLWELIETGKLKNAKDEVVNVRKLTRPVLSKSQKEAYDQGKLSREIQKKISKQGDKNLNKGIKEYTDKFGDILPDNVDWRTKPKFENKKGYEKVTEWGMTYLMTVPTNKLSRIPVFKSTYWKTSADLISVSSEKVKNKIIKGAEKAGINKRQIERWKKIESAGVAGIDDADLIEGLAKAKGVEKVKGLLYDITESRRFWDLTRWVFPFGNAYQEVISTWLGIMKANPGVVARTQTTWAGATQPTDEFEDTGKGFFFENPTNGQAVFNYPGTGLVQDWMFKDAPETGMDVKVNMPVYAQSINIAANIMPGFGPVVRIPAAVFFKEYPEEGFIQRFIFGEFAPPDLSDKDDWFKALGFKPAWVDKFQKVIFNKGENAQGIYGNTVMDTYEALLYAGLIDDSTEEGFKKGMELALSKSKVIFLIRAFTQMIGPAGVASPLYELKPENMDYFMFETLADEYRTMKVAANYDDAVATKDFLDIYGFNPLPLTVAKSVSIEKYPVTVEGSDWLKENKELYDKYPLVAWYLDPPPMYAEFSWASYKKGILLNKREYRTPEQWAIAKNKLLGSIALRQYEERLNLTGNNTQVARALRNEKKKQLQQQYWGYGQPGIVGEPNQPSIEMQVEQLVKMVDDPSVQQYATVQSAKKYLEARQEVIDGFVAGGLSDTIWKTSSKYIGVRLALREIAKQLIADNPEFGPMFDQLLARELEPEYEDDLLLELDKANNKGIYG